MIHHNRPFIPYYGPYHNYMEDGMPGTPLKVWGFLVGLIGGIAGGIVAISGVNPIIGAFVALGAVIVGIILAGLGMAKNYKENKKIRELKLKNLQQQNQLLANNPVLPIAPLQPIPLAPIPPFPNDKFPPILNTEPPKIISNNDDNKKSFNRPRIDENIFTPPIINKQIPENKNINKSMEPNIPNSKVEPLFPHDNIPNSKEERPFPLFKAHSEPGFAKGFPPMSPQNRPPFPLFGNALNKEADDINTVKNEKKELNIPMFPPFANKEPIWKTAPNFMQPNLNNNQVEFSDEEEGYDDEEEAEMTSHEKKELEPKNNTFGSILPPIASQTPPKLPPFPDFLKGNPLFAQKPGMFKKEDDTHPLLPPKPISKDVKINKNNTEQKNNLNKE